MQVEKRSNEYRPIVSGRDTEKGTKSIVTAAMITKSQRR